MKRLLMATAIACLLCGSAFAGDVPCGDYAPPAPDEPTQTVNAPAMGEIPIGGYTGSTDITLNVVETLLSLLSV
jgi:hypothetical protein